MRGILFQAVVFIALGLNSLFAWAVTDRDSPLTVVSNTKFMCWRAWVHGKGYFIPLLIKETSLWTPFKFRFTHADPSNNGFMGFAKIGCVVQCVAMYHIFTIANFVWVFYHSMHWNVQFTLIEDKLLKTLDFHHYFDLLKFVYLTLPLANVEAYIHSSPWTT